ncbi:MAG: ERCC4 domain-containing protein [Promethearchaeota archaeon]
MGLKNINNGKTEKEESQGEDLFLTILKDKFGEDFEFEVSVKSEGPYIIVDKREKRSGIVDILREMNAAVIEETLDAGDYLLSGRVCVERKRGDDYYGSLFGGSNNTNIFDELLRLSDAVDTPLLILENFTRMFKRGEEKISSLYGGLVSIATKYRIPIIPTRNIEDTALVLFRIAKQQQDAGADRGIARRAPKKMSIKDRQAFILEGLINVGPSKSQKLIEEFGTPLAFFTALLNTEIIYTRTGNPKGIKGGLEKVKGIGWKFVQDNKELLLSKDK